MLKTICKALVIVWGLGAIVGGFSTGHWFAVAMGLAAILAAT